jgi:hypothetical protein
VTLPVTLKVSTRNAAPMLEGCLESVRDWVSEIVVVDMESTDDTVAIAERHGAKVIRTANAGFAEPGRQLGIDAATQPWMLVLDADERATPGLRDLVARTVTRDDVDGIELPRENLIFGHPMRNAELWPDYQLRLFRPQKTHWPPEIHTGPTVDGRTERAPADPAAAISHLTFSSVSEWLERAERYTTIEAERRAGARSSALRIVGRPVAKFVQSYIVGRGFRDGLPGLAAAVLAAVYEALSELKLWERSR